MTLRTALLVLLSLITFASASHFRYGQITWKPVSDNGATVTIELTARWGWRRSYFNGVINPYDCVASTISSNTLIGENYNLVCDVGCATPTTVVQNTKFYCSAYKPAPDDWTIGERIWQYTFNKVTDIQIFFYNGDWVTLVKGGGKWEVRVKIDATVRSDTAYFNTSPVTSMPPVTCIRTGYKYTITIPFADADNDVVRCRWAEAAKKECAGVCNTCNPVCDIIPPATLDGDKCQITFDGNGATTGWYAAALMIEDFKTVNDTVPMSGVPLQFLIKVASSAAPCTVFPQILGDRSADACIGVPFGSTVTERIVAKLGCPTAVLDDIQILGPTGTSTSAVSLVSGTTDTYQKTLTWTPIASQRGPNVICAKISDTSCLSSDNYCFTVLAGIDPPALVSGTGTPSGLLTGATLAGNNGVITWTVQFNKPVLRAIKSSYIRIFFSNGTELVKMDTAVFPTVNYNNFTLTFETGNTFEPGSYYILFDYGAGLGYEYCKAESDAVKDPAFWTFTIAATTTTTAISATQPITSPGQTLAMTGLSSTVSWILPWGQTPTTTTLPQNTTLFTGSTTTPITTTITTTTTTTVTTTTTTTTTTSSSSSVKTCITSECNTSSLALIGTLFGASSLAAHVSSLIGAFMYLNNKKKKEETLKELSPIN